MKWFCLHTRPRKETQVAAYCRDQLGQETYFPLLRQYRVIRRVRRLVVGPLFPRYIFCRFDPAEFYRRVRYAPDVGDIVQFGGKPSVVDDALIDDLKRWVGDALDGAVIQPLLRAGDNVQITNGPLSGVTAVILRARDDADRVEILLTLLQQGAKMTIPRTHLELVPAL